MNTVRIQLAGEKRRDTPAGTKVSELLPPEGTLDGLPILAALVNNDVSSLSYPLSVNAAVQFLTMRDPHGWRVYRRSLSFLLAKTVRDAFPDADFRVEHSFGNGLYCSFRPDGASGATVDPACIARIEASMHEAVRNDVPIERHKISYEDAVRGFEASGQVEKLNLLRHRNPPRVVVHRCEGFCDLAHGPLVPSTAVLDRFELLPYSNGLVLNLPPRETPGEIPPFRDQPHLFQIFREHKEWGRILRVNTVGRLNAIITSGRIEDFVSTAEALHEKKVSRIADEIAGARQRVRVVMISGPSSAGKTTFAKRLRIHLRVNGLHPVTLGMDDYFVGPERTPCDEQGQPDFEHLDAVDVALLNRDLRALVEGREIERPRYNFARRKREYRGERLQVADDEMLIIEGIHGLNPRLTGELEADCLFRIYINALTQLNLDMNNRISTTDDRLMRRIVRDHKFRGYSALETLRQWPSVRRGEKRWIFPFQGEADATFNSALDYELAVIKPFVEPLLSQVKPSDPEYAESRRLTEFLLNFVGTPLDPVPGNSILREYLGGSVFRY